MQVAMRLGPYWWKRLGEKYILQRHVWGYFQFGSILTLTPITILVALYFSFSDIETSHLDETTIFITALCASIALAIEIVGIAFIIIAGIALTKTMIATLRFKTVFGFSPPVTDEGHKIIQLAVDRILTFRAIAREEEYSREEKIIEAIRKNKIFVAGLIDNKGDYIRDVARNVVSLEQELGKLEKSKKKAEKNYYKARNTARNPFLPIPFMVKDFKSYLPKEVT